MTHTTVKLFLFESPLKHCYHNKWRTGNCGIYANKTVVTDRKPINRCLWCWWHLCKQDIAQSIISAAVWVNKNNRYDWLLPELHLIWSISVIIEIPVNHLNAQSFVQSHCICKGLAHRFKQKLRITCCLTFSPNPHTLINPDILCLRKFRERINWGSLKRERFKFSLLTLIFICPLSLEESVPSSAIIPHDSIALLGQKLRFRSESDNICLHIYGTPPRPHVSSSGQRHDCRARTGISSSYSGYIK